MRMFELKQMNRNVYVLSLSLSIVLFKRGKRERIVEALRRPVSKHACVCAMQMLVLDITTTKNNNVKDEHFEARRKLSV